MCGCIVYSFALLGLLTLWWFKLYNHMHGILCIIENEQHVSNCIYMALTLQHLCAHGYAHTHNYYNTCITTYVSITTSIANHNSIILACSYVYIRRHLHYIAMICIICTSCIFIHIYTDTATKKY